MKPKFKVGDKVLFIVDKTEGGIEKGYQDTATITQIYPRLLDYEEGNPYALRLDHYHPRAHNGSMDLTAIGYGYFCKEQDLYPLKGYKAYRTAVRKNVLRSLLTAARQDIKSEVKL